MREALQRVEQSGIVFLDEPTRSPAARRTGGCFPDRACSGPPSIVEGSTVTTKYGPGKDRPCAVHRRGRLPHVKALGPDPELQGRFPIRVELDALGQGRVRAHPTEPQNALIKQQVPSWRRRRSRSIRAGLHREIAATAASVNERTENHRRAEAHTIIEKLLDEISFDAPEKEGHEGHDRRKVRPGKTFGRS